MVLPLGIAPSSSELQSGAMTTSAKEAYLKMVPAEGLEPSPPGPQPSELTSYTTTGKKMVSMVGVEPKAIGV